MQITWNNITEFKIKSVFDLKILAWYRIWLKKENSSWAKTEKPWILLILLLKIKLISVVLDIEQKLYKWFSNFSVCDQFNSVFSISSSKTGSYFNENRNFSMTAFVAENGRTALKMITVTNFGNSVNYKQQFWNLSFFLKKIIYSYPKGNRKIVCKNILLWMLSDDKKIPFCNEYSTL